ncbi:MAG: hypothetical protein MUF31_12520 [Akkermansiaceae bacterium]|nr:hypothetical protein [Akkermansiaceae bacterium]
MKKTIVVLIPFATLTVGPFASAAVLAQYGFNVSGTTGAPSTVASGLTATGSLAFSSAAGQTGGATSGLLPIEGARSVFTFAASVTDGTAPTVSHSVFAFSVTPDPGNMITLDLSNAVTWSFLAYDGTVNAASYSVYTAVIAATDASFTNIVATSSTFSTTTNATGFDNGRWGTTVAGDLNPSSTISSTGTLYFRLVANDSLNSGDHQLRFDNVVINGTVAPVPEPTIALLGSLGLLGLMRRRR